MKKLLLIFLFLSSFCYCQYIEIGNGKIIKNTVTNSIGTAGSKNFGVGVCPILELPSELTEISGTSDTTSDNYGNYMVKVDSSIMVYIPIFYYKIWSDNTVFIKGYADYGMDTASARTDSFAVHRAFINGGKLKKGFFVDKYDWSLSNVTWSGSTQLTGIASSRYLGNPISSSVTTKRNSTNNYSGSFSNCINNSQSPADSYRGAWATAKSRGSNFSVISAYCQSALALLSLAHGQNSTSTTYCGWYNASYNYPKGNNNTGADIDDATCTFTEADDGYWTGKDQACKTGSASTFNKSTHNGQNNGVADVNGNQYNICQGFVTDTVHVKDITAISKEAEGIITINTHGYTTNDLINIGGNSTDAEWNALLQYKIYKVAKVDDNTFKIKDIVTDAYINTTSPSNAYVSGFTSTTKPNFYTLAESVDIKDVTGTNHYDSTYIANNFIAVTPQFNSNHAYFFGNSTTQVLSGEVLRSNNAYLLTSLGLPMSNTSVSGVGTSLFGKDNYYERFTYDLCYLKKGAYNESAYAGIWETRIYNIVDIAIQTVNSRSIIYEY